VKRYATIKPLPIHRHDSLSLKEPYEAMSELQYSSTSMSLSSANDCN